LSITHEILDGTTLLEYVTLLEDKIKNMTGDTIIRSEGETAFNNDPAYLIDVEMKDNGIEFKNIIVVIQGKQDDAWTISFNTPKLDWSDTAVQFYKV